VRRLTLGSIVQSPSLASYGLMNCAGGSFHFTACSPKTAEDSARIVSVMENWIAVLPPLRLYRCT
jgi:hypothetical protein